MTVRLPRLIATSVVRGSRQGETHGGVFAVDFDKQEGEQYVDWNTTEIDFEGRGADRGLLVNDTASDCVRYVGRDSRNQAFKIVTYDDADSEFAGTDDSKIVRQAFGHGLYPVGERFIAGGSSPSTISLYDLESYQKVGSVNLTMDIRNAIHGLEPWPYDD